MSSLGPALLLSLLTPVLFLILPVETQRPSVPAPSNVSLEAADSLDRKIVEVRTAEQIPARSSASSSLVVTDVEMESFVYYLMKDEIPARIDSIDVILDEGLIGVTTELTFDAEESSGNPIVDLLMGGSHSLFVRGALEGMDGRGRFELQQVRVDGFPVPLLVVELLVSRFVNPRFPEVDLEEEFRIPWGIEGITLSPEGATIAY